MSRGILFLPFRVLFSRFRIQLKRETRRCHLETLHVFAGRCIYTTTDCASVCETICSLKKSLYVPCIERSPIIMSRGILFLFPCAFLAISDQITARNYKMSSLHCRTAFARKCTRIAGGKQDPAMYNYLPTFFRV